MDKFLMNRVIENLIRDGMRLERAQELAQKNVLIIDKATTKTSKTTNSNRSIAQLIADFNKLPLKLQLVLVNYFFSKYETNDYEDVDFKISSIDYNSEEDKLYFKCEEIER